MTSDEVRRKIDSLSPTEREVLDLVCEGVKYKDIGDKIGMSESSVKNHMKAVRLKFGINYLSRREGFIELNNTYCSALKEIRDQADKKNIAEKESKVEVKPKPQEKEEVPVKEPVIEKDKEVVKEKEKPKEDVFEKIEKKDDEKPPYEKPKKPLDEKKDGNQMDKTNQPEKDRFRTLKTIWRVIAITAIIFSGYVIYDRFIRPSPTEPAPSVEESGTDQEEVIIAEPEAIPAETVIVPTESSTTAPIAQPKPAILFEDDFDDGLSDAWELVSGNPIVVNGTLSADRDTWLLVGDPTWTNYSVEFQGESGKDHFYDGADIVALRVFDMDNMYAYKWVFVEREWYVVENGEWNIVPQTYFLEQRKENLFRFEVKGGSIKVYIDGIIESSFFDDKFAQGRIGLFISKDTVIDDFKVREVLE